MGLNEVLRYLIEPNALFSIQSYIVTKDDLVKVFKIDFGFW